jgi:hypothetical protein
MSEIRKQVKTIEEPEPNMMRPGPHEEDDYLREMMMMQQMQQGDGSPGDGKKVSYKPHNYKTVPCVFFHSEQGCSRSDTCHFIHDWNYSGRETPNMRKYVRPTLVSKSHDGTPIIPPPIESFPALPTNTRQSISNPNMFVNPTPSFNPPTVSSMTERPQTHYPNQNTQRQPYNNPRNQQQNPNMFNRQMGNQQQQQQPYITPNNPMMMPRQQNQNFRNEGMFQGGNQGMGGHHNPHHQQQHHQGGHHQQQQQQHHQQQHHQPYHQQQQQHHQGGHHQQQQHHQGGHQQQQQHQQQQNMMGGMNPQNRGQQQQHMMMNNPHPYGYM